MASKLVEIEFQHFGATAKYAVEFGVPILPRQGVSIETFVWRGYVGTAWFKIHPSGRELIAIGYEQWK